MKYLIILVLFLVGCGDDAWECATKGCPRNDNPTPDTNQVITPQQRIPIQSLIGSIRTWTPVCDGGACEQDGDNNEYDPAGYNSSHTMEWAGLLCLSGELSQCTAARNALRDDGKVCRSSLRLQQDKNSSSRDMLVGFLAYLIKTKDTKAAELMLKYIRDNNYKMCDDADDNRCNVGYIQYRAIWGTMYYVWKHLELQPSWEMKQGELGDEFIIKIQSQFSPAGYELHLTALELLLRQALNRWNDDLQSTANIILARQPDNPFYQYLANGKTSTVADGLISKCPRNKPEFAKQWSWQRATGEQAWLESIGWECIFLDNLLK